jgi:Asp-tRNA(Asn)/Glu-tRNA(Gln) amidotransferase A subunit family amidase
MMNRARTVLVAVVTIAGALAIWTIPSGAQRAGSGAASFEVMEATIPEIHAAMMAGKLTSHQLVQQYLDRIAAYDKTGPDLNCIVGMNSEALAQADKLDAEFKKTGKLAGSMHGIPVLVKDEIDVAGMPTTLGSVLFKDYRPTLDAFVIAELRKQGAIILGKTTLGEFAAGDTYGSGFAERNEAFGVSRNPYDLERTVGGSSGGSGACLSANMSAVALGEETRASIRRPGSFNAVVTMRPTAGLVSRAGMFDGWPTEHASMGPMARTVADLARLMDVMVGYDSEDPLTALGAGHKPASYAAALDKNGLKGAHIGVLRTDLGDNSDPNSQDYKNVMAVFNQTVGELKSAGAIVVDPIVIPGLSELQQVAGRRPEDEALKVWLARNPNSQFHARRCRELARRRQDLSSGQGTDLEESVAAPVRSSQIWRVRSRAAATVDQHPEGDGRPAAGRDRVPHHGAFTIADQGSHHATVPRGWGRNADAEYVSRLRAGDHGAVGLYARTHSHGSDFPGATVRRREDDRPGICLRTGDPPPSAAWHNSATWEEIVPADALGLACRDGFGACSTLPECWSRKDRLATNRPSFNKGLVGQNFICVGRTRSVRFRRNLASKI